MKKTLLLVALALLPAVAPAQDHDPYVEFIRRVQIALREQGFDPGAVNGRDEGATQAALAQFQLSRNLPASGSLDEATLQALGVSPQEVAPADEGEGQSGADAAAGAGTPLAPR